MLCPEGSRGSLGPWGETASTLLADQPLYGHSWVIDLYAQFFPSVLKGKKYEMEVHTEGW